MVKKTIMKRVKGTNAKAYNRGKADMYLTETPRRKHEIAPGDKLTCNCCGKLVLNIYQHQTTQCEPSQYYVMLQDKHREAYLFLLQRHEEFPDVWEHPGDFVMMNSKLTKKMMERLPFERLLLQPALWNILMQIHTGAVVNGKRRSRDTFAAQFADVVDELDGAKNHHWEIETGSTDKIVKKWNLHHEPQESELRWTHLEQRTMERIRAKIVEDYSAELTYPLPCTGTAGLVEGATEEMVEKAYLKDGLE